MFTKTDIEKYFMAEKQESLLFLVVGIIAIVLAIVFLIALKTSFCKGAAIPLLVIGLIQAIVGYTVYARSDDDRARNVYAYDMNPDQLKQEELPRMEKVNKNFIIYRWTEIALALAGIGLIFYFRTNSSGFFWYGFGVTLAIQSILLLGADYVAAGRAVRYTDGLRTYLSVKAH
jgi:hypothetical protein